MASSTVEDYAKAIFLAADEAGRGLVSMGKLAQALGVSPGTATSMAKKLESMQLADYAPRSGVRLTGKGRDLAVSMVRRHRLVEYFLVEVLKMDWADIHAEAEALEHAISDRLLERLDAHLGHPTADPHGDPIPDADGRFRQSVLTSLGLCEEGQTVKIGRIADQDRDFLDYASANGLRPGVPLELVRLDWVGQNVEVRLPDGTCRSLGWPAADKILVGR